MEVIFALVPNKVCFLFLVFFFLFPFYFWWGKMNFSSLFGCPWKLWVFCWKNRRNYFFNWLLCFLALQLRIVQRFPYCVLETRPLWRMVSSWLQLVALAFCLLCGWDLWVVKFFRWLQVFFFWMNKMIDGGLGCRFMDDILDLGLWTVITGLIGSFCL